MSFDEQPDADPHGECAAEIHALQSKCAHLNDTANDYRARWICAEDRAKRLESAVRMALDECVDLIATPAGNALEDAIRPAMTDEQRARWGKRWGKR